MVLGGEGLDNTLGSTFILLLDWQMVSVWVGLLAAAFNAGVLPFWMHESHSIKDKKAGQCGNQ